ASSTGQTMAMQASVGRDIERALPGARAVAISWHLLDWLHDGHDAQLVVAAVDAGTYYEANHERQANVPNLPLFRRLAEERGTAVISENLVALYGVGIGDVITLHATDAELRLKVIGVVEDYAAPRGLVLVHRDHYPTELHTGLVDIFDVYLPAGTSADEIGRARDALARSPLAAEHSLVPLTGGELRQHILGVIRRVY